MLQHSDSQTIGDARNVIDVVKRQINVAGVDESNRRTQPVATGSRHDELPLQPTDYLDFRARRFDHVPVGAQSEMWAIDKAPREWIKIELRTTNH